MSAAKAPQMAKDNSRVDSWLQAYFLIPAIVAAISMVSVFFTASEGGSAWLFGISAIRWLLFLILLLLLVGFGLLFGESIRKKSVWKVIRKKSIALVDNQKLYWFLIGVMSLASILSFYIILSPFKFTDQFVQARLERILPLSIWLFFFSLQNVVIFPQLKTPTNSKVTEGLKFACWRPTFIAFGCLVAVATLISITDIGLKPDRVGWDNPGVPLLGTQIVFASFLAILFCGLVSFVERRFGWKISRIDIVVAIVIWIIAVWSWQSQPLNPTFFSPTPRAPNFETYPYSDAATHDVGAQNLLIGDGYPDVIEKPLYSLFLSVVHTVAGQNYMNVVNTQILVLAFFPVVLYFLGSKFHHRLSGAMLAFVIIFREANSISLSGDIRVSHSKLLMTDLPSALAIAAFSLLLLSWLRFDKRDLRWPLIAGGALGLLVLLRSQAIIFLPGLLVLGFWYAQSKLRNRLIQAAIVLFGFVLVIFPWLFRNYQVTGQFGYSQPLQAAYLAKQYSLTPETAEFEILEGSSVSDYVSLGFSRVIQFTLRYPGEVAGFVSAHFFHNEVSSLLALPMRFDFADKLVTFYNLRPYWIGLEDRLWSNCCSLDTYVGDTPYWKDWDGSFPSEAWPSIFVNLVIISVGVGAAWKKLGWLILIPIGIHISYNLSTAVARVSGWRLILPVDWVLLMFYCVGIGQVILWVWGYFTQVRLEKTSRITNQKKELVSKWQKQGLFPLGAAIVFAGLLLPLPEIVIPVRFDAPTTELAQGVWNNSELSTKFDLQISDFLIQPGAEILVGRALYPRFYLAGEGEPGGTETPFNSLSFPRLVFWLIGPRDDQMAIPLEEAASFPNATDVLVIGCAENTFFRADAVLFTDLSADDLLTTSPDPFVCE